MKSTSLPPKGYMGDFSPEKTISWMTKTWKRKAHPLFMEFYDLLKSKTSVPPYYFSKLNQDSSGWNPIFRFLRPETVHSFHKCLKTTIDKSKDGGKKVDGIWDSVLHPYLTAWEDLFSRLSVFYGDESTLQDVREAFRSLRYTSSIYQEPNPKKPTTALSARLIGSDQSRNVYFDQENYTVEFNNFQKAFSRLPLTPQKTTALTEEVLSAVAKTVKAEAQKVLGNTKKISDASAIKAYKLATDYGLDDEDGKNLRRKATGRSGGKRGRPGPSPEEQKLIVAADKFRREKEGYLTQHGAIANFLKNEKNWKTIVEKLPERFSKQKHEKNLEGAIGRLNTAVTNYKRKLEKSKSGVVVHSPHKGKTTDCD